MALMFANQSVDYHDFIANGLKEKPAKVVSAEELVDISKSV